MFGNDGGSLVGSEIITDDTWHNFIVTRENDTFNIFVDGELDETSSFSGFAGDLGVNRQIHIGRFGDLSTWYFNGSIDEVRIYNRALSADEIKNLYEQRDEIHDPFVYKTV